MNVLVNISDEIYRHAKDGSEDSNDEWNAMRAIANGTPLPKGHGRLIDADVFEKRLMNARSYYIGEKVDDFDLQFAAGLKSAAERLVDAPTIIEADKERANETDNRDRQ